MSIRKPKQWRKFLRRSSRVRKPFTSEKDAESHMLNVHANLAVSTALSAMRREGRLKSLSPIEIHRVKRQLITIALKWIYVIMGHFEAHRADPNHPLIDPLTSHEYINRQYLEVVKVLGSQRAAEANQKIIMMLRAIIQAENN